jgi:ABC-type phosphate/phosphonate transport system substrate-binding protein
MSHLTASFRMYNAGPKAALAWRTLFEGIFDELSLDIGVIEHGWPDPIEDLWERADLGCAFMCGWPFVRSVRAMQPIVVPIPSPSQYAGLPRYRSEFLVREATGWGELHDTFGHHFGWMTKNSHSGFNGPRAYLSGLFAQRQVPLFSQASGPLGTPAKTLAALRTGQVDVVAVDSFYLDLCRLHQPGSLDGLRSIETTPWSPIPILVAAPTVPAQTVQMLRERLICQHALPQSAAVLAQVLVARFDVPALGDYHALESMASLAIGRGYDQIR